MESSTLIIGKIKSRTTRWTLRVVLKVVINGGGATFASADDEERRSAKPAEARLPAPGLRLMCNFTIKSAGCFLGA